MKKKFVAVLLALCLVLALCACGESSAPAASSAPAESSAPAAEAPASEAPADGGPNESLIFVTGGETGTYYAFGSVIAQYVSANTNLSVTAVSGNGSKANVEDMDAGSYELGFCQSDVMSYAHDGTNIFAETGAVDSFSAVAALYMEQVQIVTMNPDIKTVEDLRGKSVSIGAQGSGVYFNAVDVLGCYDMTIEDITPVYQSFGDSADSLKDGKIDAAFIVAGAPTTAITDLSTSGQVYLSASMTRILKSCWLSPPITASTPFPLTPTACPRMPRPSPWPLWSLPATTSPRKPSTPSFPPSLTTLTSSSTARPLS